MVQILDEPRKLVVQIAALPEPAMRLGTLAAALAKMSASEAAWSIELLIRGVVAKDTQCERVYLGLIDSEALCSLLEAEHLDVMLAVAREDGCVATVQWLLSSQAGETTEGPEPDQLIDRELAQLTLGDRRGRARRATGDLISRLALDPDGAVITNLLNNPRTTEQVVLSICSRRPTVAEPLIAVMQAPRWVQRYKVKLALAKNPYLPERFAINLLPFLNRQDLLGVRDDESLGSMLRLSAQRLVDLPKS